MDGRENQRFKIELCMNGSKRNRRFSVINHKTEFTKGKSGVILIFAQYIKKKIYGYKERDKI
ncbi:MAG: hypothetical protein sGL2_11470 [Candidatus Mesenet longicola]|nr:MAG: hypothetical protein sGL2_11470 [Candidatus Mesenet longicola]